VLDVLLAEAWEPDVLLAEGFVPDVLLAEALEADELLAEGFVPDVLIAEALEADERISKWLMRSVLPGVAEVLASFLLPVSILMRLDLPTLERPMKAYSGQWCSGHWLMRALLLM